jgi:small conductance mechanosensitive channel
MKLYMHLKSLALIQEDEPTQRLSEKLNSWWDGFILNLPNIAIALVVLVIAYFVSGFMFRFSLKLLKGRVKQLSVAKLIARAISVAVVLGGLFLALVVLDLGKSIEGLLAGAGISGLVIGLALQGTLSNTISGIVLSFRKKIKVGDWVETNGYEGTVEDISLNYLVLREADNNVVVIPNKIILENPYKNISVTPKIRVTVECGVGYESDLEQVEEITKQAIVNEFDHIKKTENVEFFYIGFGDSSINYKCRFWIDGNKAIDDLKAVSRAMKSIKRSYDEKDINIPFPIRTVKLENQNEEVEENENSEK